MPAPKQPKSPKATKAQKYYLDNIIQSYAGCEYLLYNRLTKNEATMILSIIEPIYKEHVRCKLISQLEDYPGYDDLYNDF